MDIVFGKLEGLSGIVDDTFIYGIGEAQHDQDILNILDTARENNVRFNPDKFQFKVNMHPPKNLADLQSFIGMINYLNRFSSIIAQTSEPVRQLMKIETPFM